MELLILRTLKWRMQAYTPCTFIDYFMRKMYLDEIPSMRSVSRSIQLIISTTKGYAFTTLSTFRYGWNLCCSYSEKMLSHLCRNCVDIFEESELRIGWNWIQIVPFLDSKKSLSDWSESLVGKIECRYWLLGIQAFWDCSSSGNVCIMGKATSKRHW